MNEPHSNPYFEVNPVALPSEQFPVFISSLSGDGVKSRKLEKEKRSGYEDIDNQFKAIIRHKSGFSAEVAFIFKSEPYTSKCEQFKVEKPTYYIHFYRTETAQQVKDRLLKNLEKKQEDNNLNSENILEK